jgi:hypothetical protein
VTLVRTRYLDALLDYASLTGRTVTWSFIDGRVCVVAKSADHIWAGKGLTLEGACVDTLRLLREHDGIPSASQVA